MANLSCDCGYTKSVSDEYAGKNVKCPKCNAITQVSCTEVEPVPIIRERQTINNTYRVHEKKMPTAIAVILALLWIVFGIVCGGVFSTLVIALQQANSAVQEASAGAVCGATIVSFYAIMRAIDKVVRLAFE